MRPYAILWTNSTNGGDNVVPVSRFWPLRDQLPLKPTAGSWEPMSTRIRPAEFGPQQLDTLLEDVLDALIVTDPDGEVVYMNGAAQDLYGFGRLDSSDQERLDLRTYTRETFELRTIDGAFLPDEEQPLTRTLQGESYRDVELSVTHRESGEERIFAFSGTRLDGDPPLSVLTIHDLTALRKAERRYRVSFETNPAPTVVVRLDDLVLIDSNEGFTEVTDVARSEVAGSSLAELELLSDGDDLEGVISDLKDGNDVHHRHSTIRRGSEVRDVLVSARPIEIEGEACAIFTFIDMTELLHAKRQVKRRTGELKEANDELDSFNYSVSHDLRAPLRGIDGFSQVILEEYGDRLDDMGRHYLERIRAAASQMGELIDSLLTLSRLTRGEMDSETVDLTALAREVADALREEAPERQVEFVIEDGMEVEGDEGMLRAAVYNLLENAWKFTRRSERARIEMGSESRDQGTVYVVRDNGVGFDIRYADRLFSPFQRLHPTGEFEGQGIGLAIVQRIVKRHGGRIWVEDEPSPGATFCFTLPGTGGDS